MKRRRFAGALAAALLATRAQAAQDLSTTPRFTRPELASDEGGLWALMDREEGKLRRSPFMLRDERLHAYISDIAKRLAGEHAPDVRVYLVNNKFFNANMAPNGMMQVWSGLMLRVDNEAQLAAVLGHEVGHYLARHSVESLRDAKQRSAFAAGLAMFGLVGLIGALATVASMFAYSREHERQADELGLKLMRRAGYDAAEASKIWANLLEEVKADPDTDPTKNSALFATHPAMAERRTALAEMAATMPGGETFEQRWLGMTAPYRRSWLNEEVKRGRSKESLVLLARLIQRSPGEGDYLFARAEVYRLRAGAGDLDAAMLDYRAAALLGNGPPEIHRGLGMIYRERKDPAAARAAFQQYVQLAPAATDAAMIQSYIEEIQT